jgi:hypothetical protein
VTGPVNDEAEQALAASLVASEPPERDRATDRAAKAVAEQQR